jgi:hypothetical protein
MRRQGFPARRTSTKVNNRSPANIAPNGMAYTSTCPGLRGAGSPTPKPLKAWGKPRPTPRRGKGFKNRQALAPPRHFGATSGPTASRARIGRKMAAGSRVLFRNADFVRARHCYRIVLKGAGEARSPGRRPNISQHRGPTGRGDVRGHGVRAMPSTSPLLLRAAATRPPGEYSANLGRRDAECHRARGPT